MVPVRFPAETGELEVMLETVVQQEQEVQVELVVLLVQELQPQLEVLYNQRTCREQMY